MGVSNIQIITEGNAGSISAGAIWLGPTQKANALKKIDDFSPDKAVLYGTLLNYVSDTDSPSGYAVQLLPGANPSSYYTFPLRYGAYSPSTGFIGSASIPSTNIIGPGYHYYKLMDITPSVNDFYFYFFGDSTLQYPSMGGVVDKYGVNVHYAVWASIKFTGPAYPYGNAGDPNGIYVERVFLVRDASPLNFDSNQANLNGNSLLSVVAATDTESGHAVRLSPGANPNPTYYAMPLKYGSYCPSRSNYLGTATLSSANVVGSGYHYYKLMSFNADRDFYFYFFGDWTLQYKMYGAVAENGPGKYSAWARLKFTGPAYPYGNTADPNGIYVDRMILVKDTKPLVTLSGIINLNGNPLLSVVTDPDAPSGHAVRLLPGANPSSYYTMPLIYGAWCQSLSQYQGFWSFPYGNVVGAGYHDYTLATFTPDANNFYIYFFGNWTLQYQMTNVLITNGPGVSYAVHASIKFTGPAYPYGNASDPNGIYIDNVRLVPVP